MSAASTFIPRSSFPQLTSLPRSYFLGHHQAGLAKMKTMLSSIDLILECRDYRIPLTSHNPLFEESLTGKQRVVIYTKRDLGSSNGGNSSSSSSSKVKTPRVGPLTRVEQQREMLLTKWHAPSPVFFSDHKDKRDTRKILDFIRAHTASTASSSLAGARVMIIGMPNIGKSSLLNSLRSVGVGKRKSARTGAQPGVTRKIGTSVKIIAADIPPAADANTPAKNAGENANIISSRSEREGDAGSDTGTYILDTPGVFMPYVPDAEAMLKLALCGCVKDTIVPLETVADYLLYHFNRQHDPSALYGAFCPPTNDVTTFLDAVARRTGRLKKGGQTDTAAAAAWVLQRWRAGHFGHFLLDDVVSPGALLSDDPHDNAGAGTGVMHVTTREGSLNQAKKAEKAERRARSLARRQKIV
ncbi:MAG: hypothetical protein M1825_001374 [Sarcosagium campestre]|nr:MAG: hypothetical protein M1825_001374 [Sarcosagium campestre]